MLLELDELNVEINGKTPCCLLQVVDYSEQRQ